MKIYTKTGDGGETGLLGGIRVSKSHLAIEACGSLDETNSFIGLVRSALTENLKDSKGNPDNSLLDDLDECLIRIQHDLFDLGSRVAASLGESGRAAEFPPDRAAELEGKIDKFDSELPPLTAFILPGGSRAGSLLHLARSVCRRSERDVVALVAAGTKIQLSHEIVYLNRLSDFLFVVARVANLQLGQPETTWNVGRGENQ